MIRVWFRQTLSIESVSIEILSIKTVGISLFVCFQIFVGRKKFCVIDPVPVFYFHDRTVDISQLVYRDSCIQCISDLDDRAFPHPV